MDRRAKRPKGKADTKRPPARKPETDGGARIRDLEQRLAEALEREAGALKREAEALNQQTATSEILRVIASSPTDLQPVFDVIVGNALRLCDGLFSTLFRFDGEMIAFVAHASLRPEWTEAVRSNYPTPPRREHLVGRAILERRVVHLRDAADDPEVAPTPSQRVLAYRSALAVPMLREGVPIGAIGIGRGEVKPFTDQQIALLQTFADQAVIAIENVRLFKELQARNRELTTALDQQTATSEILRVISGSPTDVQPVFNSIVKSAVQLCDAAHGVLFQEDGGMVRLAAHHNFTGEARTVMETFFPAPVGGPLPAAKVISSGETLHVADVQTGVAPETQRVGKLLGFRNLLIVPMMLHGRAIGALSVARSEVGMLSQSQVELLQTFADQAVIAIENVRLFRELKETNSALTEALEQQTATGEILRVISSSPTEIQPVFDAIVGSAARLCDAVFSALGTFDGEQMNIAAAHNWSPAAWAAARRTWPARPSRALATGRAILDRAVVHVPDVERDPDYYSLEMSRAVGARSMLAVPMLRDGVPLGAITVARAESGPFSDSQIALLKAFADQAVIAIENVRLFNETKEALERQTATAEILKVISSSPTDVQPVFDAIVRAGTRLCEAGLGFALRYDGQLMTLVANHDATNQEIDAAVQAYPRPATPDSLGGRVVLERAVVQIADISKDPTYRLQAIKDVALGTGLGVPLLREGTPIGAFGMWRREVRPFGDRQIELLKTFADQAVIAIENVRLFTELQRSNRELTTALDTQTATSDILRVISRSQTDVQPVFDAIVASAVRLLGAYSGTLTRIADDQIEIAARTSTDVAGDAAQRALFPQSLQSEGPHPQAIRDRAPLNLADVPTDPRFPESVHAVARARGYRSQVVVPMLRHGAAIGTISVARREPGGFTDDEIALLQTFADQAVIAIENARLLSELQARTAELTRSVDELTALGDVSRALSSTLDLETVLQTIVMRANEIAGTAGCTIWEYDDAREEFRLRASDYPDEEDAAALQAVARVTTIRKGQGVTTLVMEGRQAVQIANIAREGAYESPIRQPLIEAGHHALLAVPLLSEDEVIGVLAVTRRTPGEFEPETVRLLSTFATQSALAIQNARLFLEIEDKGRQLEAASRHKSEFLANMSHELRTPLNAIIGFSEVLIERMFGDLGEKQDEYLRDIHASGQHLLSLINDILDLSKIEAGRMELELTDFDLPTTIDNAMILMRERAGRRGVSVDRHVDERLPEIRADERKVKQVLLNLLSNALKFTPEGGRIEVRAAVKESAVEVSVADTGVGIAPEDQEAVFEEFRQVGTADKKVEGTGLGLALSRKFIELHGGRIWVKSQLGEGSTFTFTLPGRQEDKAVSLP